MDAPHSRLVLSFTLFLTCLFLLAHAHADTLHWDRPEKNPPLSGYKIHGGQKARPSSAKGPEDFSYDFVVPTGNTKTSYPLDSLPQLKAGTRYFFTVTAVSTSGGESKFSNEIPVDMPDLPVTPPPPPPPPPPLPGEFPDPRTPDLADIQHDTDSNGTTNTPHSPRLVTGRMRLNQDWKQVSFAQPFTDPIVIAKPLSANGTHETLIRLRNVEPTGFEIRLQEWDYLDGQHKYEVVYYLVMERSHYMLPDGTHIEAGSVQSNGTADFAPVTFQTTFTDTPVVFTTIGSFNNANAVTSRVNDIDANGFQLHLQEQEANRQNHGAETVMYIAWSASVGTVKGLPKDQYR